MTEKDERTVNEARRAARAIQQNPPGTLARQGGEEWRQCLRALRLALLLHITFEHVEGHVASRGGEIGARPKEACFSTLKSSSGRGEFEDHQHAEEPPSGRLACRRRPRGSSARSVPTRRRGRGRGRGKDSCRSTLSSRPPSCAASVETSLKNSSSPRGSGRVPSVGRITTGT